MGRIYFKLVSLCVLKRPLSHQFCDVRLVHQVENSASSQKTFNSLDKIKRGQTYDEGDRKPKIASRVCLTVVGNGAVGQPQCLCMFTDHKHYMFNCGEGSVRLMKEQDGNVVNIRQVFITENTWEKISGLADLYLTQKSYGVPKLTLYGPTGLENFKGVISAKHKNLRITLKSVENSNYCDNTMEVEFVPIYRKQTNKFYKHRRTDDAGTPSKEVVSYICKILKKPGTLLFQKCIELGVPIGPLLLDLKNEKDITLPSGKQVKSCDVHEPDQPETVFLVVDCPSEGLIDTFTSENKFTAYQVPSQRHKSVAAVFHFSPPHVIQSHKYQQWMDRFHHETSHVILNCSNSTLSSESVHQLQHILHLMHPRIFPLLHEQPCNNFSESLLSNRNIIQADAMLQLHLRPTVEFDRSNVIELCPESYIAEAKTTPEFNTKLIYLKEAIEKNQSTKLSVNNDEEYPEIIFLGTSSSLSTAWRNVTAILINLSENQSILLDCGEGTYRQLLRYFGYYNISSVLKKISCVFLSHQHIDHYMGLFQLVKARKEAFLSCSEPYSKLAVLSNRFLDSHITHFHRHFESVRYDMRLFPNGMLINEGALHNILKEYVPDIKLYSVPVTHCDEAYGLILSNKNWKIVYSGDAAPSQTLIDAGKDCTLLIHEASLEDGFSEEASLKLHSTPSQVVEIAEQMNAKHTIMTHFSSRYLQVPVLPDLKRCHIGCAYDNMSVRLSELPLVSLFTPILKCLFTELLESHHEKTVSVTNFKRNFVKSFKA